MGGISIQHSRSRNNSWSALAKNFFWTIFLLLVALMYSPTYRNAPSSFPRSMNPTGLVEGILRGVLR